MGKEEIVQRILEDAQAAAAETVAAAKQKAEEILRGANARMEADKEAATAEAEARAKRISEGKAASARLDAQKILLAEKRRVIDGVYLRALAALLVLDERESLRLSDTLLQSYAEEGDEIVFAENYPYADGVGRLPIVKERGLNLSEDRLPLDGGFLLRGRTSDKDLSYGALLAKDREEHQAEIALKLFGAN